MRQDGGKKEAKVWGSDFKARYGPRGTDEGWRMDSKVEQLANSTRSHPCGHTSEVDNNSGAGPRDLSDNPSEGDCGHVSSMSPILRKRSLMSWQEMGMSSASSPGFPSLVAAGEARWADSPARPIFP